MSFRTNLVQHLDRLRDFEHIIHRLKGSSSKLSTQDIELVRCLRILSKIVENDTYNTNTDNEYKSAYRSLWNQLRGHHSENGIRHIGGQPISVASKRKSVSRSPSTHKSVIRKTSTQKPLLRNPSTRTRSSQRRKSIQKASSKTILQRAWHTLLYSLNALQGIITTSVTTFVAVLKYAVSLFFSALRMAMQVAFAPVRWIGSLLKTGTRAAFKKAIYYWKSCMGVLLLVLTMIFSTDLYTLVHDVFLKNGKLNEEALQRIRHKINAIWVSSCVPLASFVAVGIPQLTYDMLRVWHMLLLDGSTKACFAVIGSTRYIEDIIGSEWMASVGGVLTFNKTLHKWYKRIIHDRKTRHRGDPLVTTYVHACNTFPKQVSSKSLQSFEWNAQATQTWQYFLKRYVRGDIDSAGDVRHAKLTDLVHSTLSSKTRQGLDNQWKRMIGQLPDNLMFSKSQHMTALHKGMTNVHRWASRSANNLTVYHLMCGYFMLVSQGPGCIEGIRDALVAIKNAKNAAAIGAAYEILGVSERLE